MTGANCTLMLTGPVFLSLFAMWRVAVIDVRRLEIDVAWLVVVVVSALSAPLVTGSIWAVSEAVAVGAITASLTALVVLLRPGQFSEGDIWLMGTVGVISGPILLPSLMLVLVILAAGTRVAYSHAREKQAFLLGFPLALPAMTAAAPFLLLQFAAAVWPYSLAAELAQFDMIDAVLSTGWLFVHGIPT